MRPLSIVLIMPFLFWSDVGVSGSSPDALDMRVEQRLTAEAARLSLIETLEKVGDTSNSNPFFDYCLNELRAGRAWSLRLEENSFVFFCGHNIEFECRATFAWTDGRWRATIDDKGWIIWKVIF